MLFSMLQSLSIIVLKMVTIDQWYNGLCIWGPIHIQIRRDATSEYIHFTERTFCWLSFLLPSSGWFSYSSIEFECQIMGCHVHSSSVQFDTWFFISLLTGRTKIHDDFQGQIYRCKGMSIEIQTEYENCLWYRSDRSHEWLLTEEWRILQDLTTNSKIQIYQTYNIFMWN